MQSWLARLIGVLALATTASVASAEVRAVPPAHGTEPVPPYETIVTAGRRDEVAFESARAISVTRRTDMDAALSRTVPEALSEEAGVFIQRTNYGGGAPVIRGMLGNRILLLVDGIRLNNAAYRSGPNQYLNTVDPLLVSRIELVRGPGSVYHGSDALGGVINVLTQTPTLGTEPSGFGSARIAAASVDRSLQTGLRAGFESESLGALVVGSVRRFGDLRAARGRMQPFTGYTEWNISSSGLWQPRVGQRLQASYQSTRQHDVGRGDRSTPGDFRLFALQGRQLGYLRYQVRDVGPLTHVQATASYGRQQEVQDRFRIARDRHERDNTRVDTLGLQIEAVRGTFVMGADAYSDEIRSRGLSGDLTGTLSPSIGQERYPKGVGYASAALFTGYEAQFGPAWRLAAEARAGMARIKLPRDNRLPRLFANAELPVLAAREELVPTYAGGVHARFAPETWLSLSVGGMLGFRAPNIDDYARLGAEGPGFVLPTRSLSPERAFCAETGLKLKNGRTELSVFYAYTHIDDALARRPAALGGLTTIDGLRTLEVANAEAARYHSVEIFGRAPLWRRLSVIGSFAWTQGEQDTVFLSANPSSPAHVKTEPTSKTPPPFGSVGLGWRAPNQQWFAETVARFALAQSRLSDTDKHDSRICPQVPGRCVGSPAWAVLSARAGYRFDERWHANLVVENITDTPYRSHASGVDGAGLGLHAMVEGSL